MDQEEEAVGMLFVIPPETRQHLVSTYPMQILVDRELGTGKFVFLIETDYYTSETIKCYMRRLIKGEPHLSSI